MACCFIDHAKPARELRDGGRAHPKPNTWPVAMAKLLPLGALVLCALAAAEDVTDTKAPVAVDEPMTPTSSWFGEGTFFHRRCAPFSLFEHRA